MTLAYRILGYTWQVLKIFPVFVIMVWVFNRLGTRVEVLIFAGSVYVYSSIRLFYINGLMAMTKMFIGVTNELETIKHIVDKSYETNPESIEEQRSVFSYYEVKSYIIMFGISIYLMYTAYRVFMLL
jgi:hypothetical protein